jgi:2',3'-cyclic-nucleotide 2'-phosphodiesterase (5'-nucleotidase family)
MMRKWLFVWLMLAACAAVGNSEPREVVIFHTNDIHGHFLPEPASWRKDHASVGGVVALYDQLQKMRALHPASMYLDAGDLMTGNPVCNMDFGGVKGGALREMLHRCNITAECLGNHEFDLGAEHLRAYVSSMPYPLLCANLRNKTDGKTICAPSQVFEINGVRVGVIGLLLDNLAGVAASTAVKPFLVDKVATIAQRQIDQLKPKADLVVLLTHEGVDEDSVLATKIHGANVIVGGHSHTRLEHALRVNGVLIVQAGSHLKDLGMLDLMVDGDSVSSYRDSLISLVVPEHPSRSPVSELADSLGTVIQTLYGQKIGELAENWTRGYYNGSNVGNWICDRLRERYKADVAFVNAGGIRSDLNAGPVTMLQIQEMLPFENSIVTFEATGRDLMKTAFEQARAQGLHKHGALEMSGMSVEFSKNGDNAMLDKILIDGKPISPDKNYRVVSIDYVAVSQYNEYLKFKPRKLDTSSDVISDVIGDEIRKCGGPIHADATPRIKENH